MNRRSKLKLKKTLSGFRIIFIVAIIAAVILGAAIAQNNVIIPKNYVYQSSKIPKSFVGYKVVHISDIGNTPMMLESMVDKIDPDIVVVTGNLSNSSGEYSKAVKAVGDLAKKHSVVYVLGELDSPNADTIRNKLNEYGATSIEDISMEIPSPDVSYDSFVKEYIGDKYVRQAQSGDKDASDYLEYTKKALEESKGKSIVLSGLALMEPNIDFVNHVYGIVSLDKDIFQILAFNQSQYFDNISLTDVDMALSGNTFGVDRFSNGYSSGLYSKNGTAMFLSSGTGRPVSGNMRVLNFPSISCITLSDGTIKNENPLEKFLSYFIDDVGTRFENDKGFTSYRYDY